MAEAMPLFPTTKALLALALSMAATVAAAAPETVHFISLDGATNLTAFLSRPADQGDAPRPALVLLHGCSGLVTKSGRVTRSINQNRSRRSSLTVGPPKCRC
jgi:poly(3-hydroxybutyrate) depolymerase